MNIDIEMRPGASVANISMEPGDKLTAEAGAMIAMSEGISMTTSTYQKKKGGILSGIKRMISGESFFLNHYETSSNQGNLYLSATFSGDMFTHKIEGNGLTIQGTSYVASTPGVQVDLDWQGLRGIFSGEGMFWIKTSGEGDIIINSYGAIYSVDIEDEYIVDSGHIVAFENSLSYEVTKVGNSWLSSFLGGEGLVCKFKGKGKLWCQSHNPSSLGNALSPMLKPRK
ncbi:TIGR00266 family protein [Aureibacter tunicatorum]|uniref:Uncharacterized protein (TIGR00266 family) n=1 Tax=Aureibacter tunicatorum TaxID=866807 RepID=A0AAE3XPU0_9BACT|nr:TIGR00266 family protein [Aureibacter tunicatorum]MDR6241836.1 uncharacterized protein (TIGR00266 family) [Aureibacter tunicatorum]BDD07083.1 TIGR00266 family protein [Aureibacter tunicatorum]